MAYSSVWEKPILQIGEREEGDKARALLEEHDIDFEIRNEAGRGVSLEWNGIVYQGLLGVADFLMFVARQPIPGVRKSDRAVDGRPTGGRIPIPTLRTEAGP
jgi:hypothetical protein